MTIKANPNRRGLPKKRALKKRGEWTTVSEYIHGHLLEIKEEWFSIMLRCSSGEITADQALALLQRLYITVAVFTTYCEIEAYP